MADARRLEYEGAIYVKPIGRGIVLEERDGMHLTDAIAFLAADFTGDWHGRARIVVELLEELPREPRK